MSNYKYLLWAIAILSIATMWMNTPEIQKIFYPKSELHYSENTTISNIAP